MSHLKRGRHVSSHGDVTGGGHVSSPEPVDDLPDADSTVPEPDDAATPEPGDAATPGPDDAATPEPDDAATPEPDDVPKRAVPSTHQGLPKGPVPSALPADVSGFDRIARPVARHRRSAKPYGGWYDQVVARLHSQVAYLPDEADTEFGQLTLYVPKDRLIEVVRAARDDDELRFETCTSVSAVHYPDETGEEFHVVYSLLSMTHNRRILLEVTTSAAEPVIDSVTGVYPHADWHEREAWDMFGIIFTGHPGLTRILMPDDWDGHPLRKDYPLGGVPIEFKGAKVPPPHERRS